jgi:hypothetical protein
VERRCLAVAEHGPAPARQHGCHPPAFGGEALVADGVNGAMDA